MNSLIKISLFFLLIFSCINVNAQKKKNAVKQKNTSQNSKQKKTANTTRNVVKRGNVKNNNTPKTTLKKEENAAIDITEIPEPTTILQLSKDTSKPSVVTITSAFKPSLRNASKISFTASAPELDTSRFTLNYNIPAQNLVFSYQPVPIKPLALTSDSDYTCQNNQYIKVGFGNYTIPYLETGLSFGHPNTSLYNIFGSYFNAKSNVAFQEDSKANLKIEAAFAGISNHTLLAAVGYQLASQNKYGFSPAFTFTKDQLQQNFNTINAAITLHSKADNSYGIGYHPQIKASYFFDNNNAKETSVMMDAPITKTITDNTTFLLGVNADISSYTSPTSIISNNIFGANAAARVNTKMFAINIGLKPTWNNSLFTLLPNIFGTYKLSGEKLQLIAGWLGSFQKNTYQSLAVINPFIDQPKSLTNTKINEIFAGLKGSAGKHFTFNTQISFLNYNNVALFANDSVAAKSQNFNVLYEPNLKAIKIAGEIGFTDKEKFSFLTSIKYTQFISQESYPKAYGIIPLEISSTLKYKLLKDVLIKSGLFVWDGSYYRVQTIQSNKTSAAIDMNIGVEFKALKKLNLYIDLNNIFNNKYQRWNQYNVFGFNIVGGVVYSFR